jgi:NADH pyrophosphatase NudC (nudix superfamily)
VAPIRHIAICVFRDGNRILVTPGQGDVKNERFFRPLGGAVEFRESAEEALHREICEEPGREIENVGQLEVVENRFEYRGRPSR